MKKINSDHSNKDRILCITIPGKNKLFYQPENSRYRIWLFDTDFSDSIFVYFRKYGRSMDDAGYSLTIGELYHANKHRNSKLSKLMDRISRQTDYVIRESLLENKKARFTSVSMYFTDKMRAVHHDDEYAA